MGNSNKEEKRGVRAGGGGEKENKRWSSEFSKEKRGGGGVARGCSGVRKKKGWDRHLRVLGVKKKKKNER